jgi:hypothetical protein
MIAYDLRLSTKTKKAECSGSAVEFRHYPVTVNAEKLGRQMIAATGD